MLAEILPRNAFHAARFATAGLDPRDIRCAADLQRLPCLTKDDLLADQQAQPPYGSVLTYPAERYCRLHQTSGTSGRPLRWLDTPESWNCLLGCWEQIFDVTGVRAGDRLFFGFSFGPFLGFWTAFEAAAARTVVPARRRHVQRRPIPLPPRSRRHRCFVYAHLRPAPRRTGGAGGHRPGVVSGAGATWPANRGPAFRPCGSH